MHIPRIYINQPLVEKQTIELSQQAAHHIATVMRMKAGREVVLFNGQLFNGKAGEFSATLAYVDKKNVCIAVGDFVERHTESVLQTELGICLIKNDRMDWLLQKAAELGVSTLSPLWSEYTDVKIPADRIEKKLHHWRQILISACEQCGRTRIPVLNPPQKLSAWIEIVKADQKIILHPYADADSEKACNVQSVALLVGPEGGFSSDEVKLAIQKDFQSLMLGPRILRAETAPLVAVTLMQYQYGDYLFNE